jgi:hypothetical protein
MKLTKCHIKDISNLIFQGYLTCDVFLLDSYITIRSLTTKEREEIIEKYKYLSQIYNFQIVV